MTRYSKVACVSCLDRRVCSELGHSASHFILSSIQQLGSSTCSSLRQTYTNCPMYIDFCTVLLFFSVLYGAKTEAVALVDKMARPSPERADLLREFFLHRFSNNFDQKQQGAETKRDKFFSREAVDGIKQVGTVKRSVVNSCSGNHAYNSTISFCNTLLGAHARIVRMEAGGVRTMLFLPQMAW